jgi:hypothetical protein
LRLWTRVTKILFVNRFAGLGERLGLSQEEMKGASPVVLRNEVSDLGRQANLLG